MSKFVTKHADIVRLQISSLWGAAAWFDEAWAPVMRVAPSVQVRCETRQLIVEALTMGGRLTNSASWMPFGSGPCYSCTCWSRRKTQRASTAKHSPTHCGRHLRAVSAVQICCTVGQGSLIWRRNSRCYSTTNFAAWSKVENAIEPLGRTVGLASNHEHRGKIYRGDARPFSVQQTGSAQHG